MEPAQQLYNQAVTHFRLRLFLRPTSEMPGQLFVELASIFLDDLRFPGSVITSLDTKRAGEGAKVNMGEFSERRWNAAVKNVLAGAYAVLGLTAHTPDFPNQKIWLYLHANPPGGKEILGAGTIEILCLFQQVIGDEVADRGFNAGLGTLHRHVIQLTTD